MKHLRHFSACAGLLAPAALLAQTAPPSAADLALVNERITAQVSRLADLRRALDREEAALTEMRRSIVDQILATQRSDAATATATSPPNRTMETAHATVGVPEPEPEVPRNVPAPIFEDSSVLTPNGRYVLESSLQYSYASSSRVALLGYTVIPSVLVGLIDIRDIQRNTFTAALTGRYGVTPRLELEARVPYVYRSDTTVGRASGSGTSIDTVSEAQGNQLGDIELAARYQLARGSADMPYLVGSLRFKSRTGKDPFEVVSDCAVSCSSGSTAGTGLPLTLPTGSGFYSLQPGLTWLIPSDPAVLFGSITYLHNFKRSVTRRVLAGGSEDLGTIAPGDVFGLSVGVGVALNEQSSFSLGYDHDAVGRTRQNGSVLNGSVSTQLGTLLIGYSHRLGPDKSLNFTLGAGLTRDTPDVTLSMRVPVMF